ncbi:hypothetical protein [Streptomyces chiangmaiensis]|uniref:hypothetical protein n=1 Tax=Streptomyces chiangmaiensis TaxID=766497 RepID=UPI00337D5A37
MRGSVWLFAGAVAEETSSALSYTAVETAPLGAVDVVTLSLASYTGSGVVITTPVSFDTVLTLGRPNVSYVCVATLLLASVALVTWPRSS